MTLDGMNVTAQTVWTDSVPETPDGAASNPATCQDWTTVGSAVGGVAQPTYAGTWAFGYGVTRCLSDTRSEGAPASSSWSP
jgi:hypothetical protein